MGAEELVGQEQDLPVRRDGRHDLRRVGGGAAQIGFGFDLGAGVHVGDDDGSGVLRFPLPHLLAVMVSASEQPAPGSGISTVRSGARILAVSAMK